MGKNSLIEMLWEEAHQLLIDHRISTYEAGYPFCEARYFNISAYEKETGRKFND